MIRRVLPALAGALTCLAAGAFAAPSPGADDRYVDVIDFSSMSAKFLDDRRMLDPAFADAVAKPLPYYGDFFGIQALKDHTATEIERDFSRVATVVGRDEHSITLRFKRGYEARFYPLSTFSAFGMNIPFDHARFSGDSWRDLVANLSDFRATVRRAGLEGAYFIPNPTYSAELEVARRRSHPAPPAPITVDPALALYDRSQDAVLLAPEGVHGHTETFERIAPLLASHHVDWLGMEMLTAEMQPALDDFTNAPEGSPRYAAARARLLAYFKDSWNGRAGPKTTAEENYYFKLADLARRSHVRVIGMENVPAPFFIFRYGESAFGGAVRSDLWAKTLPRSGHGVVFGGSGHFTGARPLNVQDFIHARAPAAVLVSLDEIRARPGT